MTAEQSRTWSGAWRAARSLTRSWKRLPVGSAAGGGRGKRRWLGLGLGLTLAVSSTFVATNAFGAGDPCNPLINAIACENSKPGNPWQEWDISGAGDPTIQGYSTDISANVGGSISFKIKTDAHAYTIDIYRLGYYNGDGARKIASVTPSASLPQTQPSCVTDPSTEIFDCGTWAVSASWSVPATAVSGVYIAKLKRTDTGGSSHIPFVVRNDASTSQVDFQTSDTTWQAYNTYGGSDFYVGAANGRAYKLSYNRPLVTRGDNSGRDFLFSNEFPMIKFLESNGYDVSYTSGVDSDRRGDLIKNHKVFLSVGHDEYWSGNQRANVEAARDAGVNLAFFSGNEVYWKTRWESSEDGSSTAYRTLTSYKETWANAKIDPSTEWTGTWRDPRFSPPANGGRPENQFTGTGYLSNFVDLAIEVPAQQGKNRLWRNTSVANLAAGQTAALAEHTIGYEADEDLDNGFRPAGLIHLSATTGPAAQYLTDFGNTVVPGTTTHNMTLYKAASGALVFSAGSIQYAWGLDQDHDGNGDPADPRLQQATVNLLADMHAQPGTLQAGLVAASASTDTTAPTVTINAPASGATLARGAQTTLTGTAADVGGQVAGTEVSIDGGATWHAAVGTSTWTYTFIASGVTSMTVSVRSTDDSANTIATPVTRTFALSGPSSVFGASVPKQAAADDGNATELGLRFTPTASGYITGIRFYKGTGNTGTHTGSLWSNTGTRLATATFTNETASGWQQVTFATPVAVVAGTKYVASYTAPNGHYSADAWTFSYRDIVSGPLTAPRAIGAATTGLFTYGAGFPTGAWQDTNYYVDVLYSPSDDSAPAVVGTSPAVDATEVAVGVHPTATFSKNLNPSTLVFTLKTSGGATVPGSVAYDAPTKVATFTPTAALAAASTYTATVTAKDTSGISMASPFVWSFGTEADPSIAKLFPSTATPAVDSADDANGVELGVKFTPAASGTVVGLRFYKGAGNTGTHVGSIWALDGTLLARVTFTNETATGWQTANLSAPVALTGGTTYIASYFAANGHYAYTSAFFASTYTNSAGNLTAPAGSNGLYKYTSAPSAPDSSWNSTNYWVDPIFTPGASAPAATSIFADNAVPIADNWDDNAAIEVGVKLTSDVPGVITGMRFYKGAGNTGTHVGTLWSAAGVALATATFTGETSSGWQSVTFSQPVSITAGTVYIASYSMGAGHYAVDVGALATGFDHSPLHVPATGGLYLYGGGFPTNAVNHNYWVDVKFQPAS